MKVGAGPRVAPTDAATHQDVPKTYISRGETLLGFVYLAGSILCSFVYLGVLRPHVANDMWWPHFNATGVQTFLADLVNAKMSLSQLGPLDLFGVAAAVEKRYSVMATFIDVRPSYARQHLLAPMPVADAIAVMRQSSFDSNMQMLAPYCWVDLNRSFELALSRKRQLRCNTRFFGNGFYYLDAVMRNVELWTIATSTSSDDFFWTVIKPINDTVEGAQWVASTKTRAKLPIDAEVRVWRGCNISTWVPTMNNLVGQAIDDVVTVSNAIGMALNLTINKAATYDSDKSRWTTMVANMGLWNAMAFCNQYGFTLVRNSPRHFEALTGRGWDAFTGVDNTPLTIIVRRTLGPFGTIDIVLVPVLPSLVSLFVRLQQEIARLASASPDLYLGIAEPAVDAVPAPWTRPGTLFLGGNPLCVQNGALPYVHSIFSYSDNCRAPTPFSLALSRQSLLFALVGSGGNASTFRAACGLCRSTAASCHESVEPTAAYFDALMGQLGREGESSLLSALRQNATTDLYMTAIALIQYRTDGRRVSMLAEPLVSSTPWSFFGWTMLHDWVVGLREVYTFHGDDATYTFITEVQRFTPLAAIASEIPRHACDYVWYTSICVTVVVVFVGAMTLLAGAAMQLHVVGRNLFQFHRVVGSVWIGRSFIVLRGGAAVVVLSSSPLVFHTNGAGFSQLRFTPRSPLEIAILASEATWLAYAVTDILVPFTAASARRFGPLANFVAFGYMCVRELASPTRAAATLTRSCDVVRLSLQMKCHSGVVEYGSWSRLVELVLVNLVSVFTAYAVVWVVGRRQQWPAHVNSRMDVSLPAAAQVFLTLEQSHETVFMDAVSCIMSGFVPFRSYLLDVKLLLVSETVRATEGCNFRKATFASAPRLCVGGGVAPPAAAAPYAHVHVKSAVGLMYMALSVWGSFQFLVMTESRMTNDFWWATFNSTGMQTYLVNFFNRELLLQSTIRDLKLDNPTYGDWFMDYGGGKAAALVLPTFAASIQDEVNDIGSVIRGLRTMDACLMPWISTAYCFVDFARRWELAPTQKMADRCRRTTDNGAVYLEAILRNAKWDQLHQCWGEELDVAIYSHLRTTRDGVEWMAALRSTSLAAVDDEINLWMSHNISRYTTQWQNYKSVGLLETMAIENAFGIQFTLTLKMSQGQFTFNSQSSLKMAWSLGMALGDVHNRSNTPVSGKSLIRSSAAFAFGNLSVSELLVQRGYVETPFDAGFTAFEQAIGPFGSVHLGRVAVPRSLRAAYSTASNAVTALFATNASAQAQIQQLPLYTYMSIVPTEWATAYAFTGGSPLCDSGRPRNSVTSFFLPTGACSASLGEESRLGEVPAIVALMMTSPLNASTPTSHLQAVCAFETKTPRTCARFLQDALRLVSTMIRPGVVDSVRAMAAAAMADMRDVHIMQYVVDANMTARMSAIAIFDDPTFEFFAWTYAMQWVAGVREVVSFDGDHGHLTVLSAMEFISNQTPNSMEVPVNVAAYTRILLQYVTQFLGAIAALACVYIVLSRGHVEMWNIFQFNRVAGLVWIGHPLLLLRGVVAIALLSTDTLELQRTGFVTRISSTPTPWLTTLVSSGEVGWFVYFLNDVFSLVTGDVTTTYGWKHPAMVWAIAAVWGVVNPVRYFASVNRHCVVNAVDFDVACASAVIQIGRFNRFCGLLAISIVCGAVCFAVDKHRSQTQVRVAGQATARSKFLSASAHFMFEGDQWKCHDVYYLDRASAVITGLVTVEWNDTMYVVDVKKWRAFVMDVSPFRTDTAAASRSKDLFARAIPLIE